MAGTRTYAVHLDEVEWLDWNPSVPASEDILDGPLEMKIAVASSSADGRFVQGVWRCNPAVCRVTQPWEETLVVLEGAMSYTPAGGSPARLEVGDMMVLDPGVRYLVEVHEPVLTFWTIYSPDAPIDVHG
jgi:uncharacterized cupin superfamily protein